MAEIGGQGRNPCGGLDMSGLATVNQHVISRRAAALEMGSPYRVD